MLRGVKKFKCHKCGRKFLALDIEWNATVYSMPQKCPSCGSMHTMPSSLTSWINLPVYEEIWKGL